MDLEVGFRVLLNAIVYMFSFCFVLFFFFFFFLKKTLVTFFLSLILLMLFSFLIVIYAYYLLMHREFIYKLWGFHYSGVIHGNLKPQNVLIFKGECMFTSTVNDGKYIISTINILPVQERKKKLCE